MSSLPDAPSMAAWCTLREHGRRCRPRGPRSPRSPTAGGVRSSGSADEAADERWPAARAPPGRRDGRVRGCGSRCRSRGPRSRAGGAGRTAPRRAAAGTAAPGGGGPRRPPSRRSRVTPPSAVEGSRMHQARHVHVRRRRLQVQEGGVETGETLHGDPPASARSAPFLLPIDGDRRVAVADRERARQPERRRARRCPGPAARMRHHLALVGAGEDREVEAQLVVPVRRARRRRRTRRRCRRPACGHRTRLTRARRETPGGDLHDRSPAAGRAHARRPQLRSHGGARDRAHRRRAPSGWCSTGPPTSPWPTRSPTGTGGHRAPAVLHVGGPVEEHSGWCLAGCRPIPTARGSCRCSATSACSTSSSIPTTWPPAFHARCGSTPGTPGGVPASSSTSSPRTRGSSSTPSPTTPSSPTAPALWQRILARQGGSLAGISLFPPDPRLN